jgi:hypothetical protein
MRFVVCRDFARSGDVDPQGSSTMTKASEAVACAGIVEDIAALARKFAEKEPYKSASGPEALVAFATHLDGMIARDRTGQPRPIRVAVRKKRSI